MIRCARWSMIVLLLFAGVLSHGPRASAEKVADLPIPTHYVNDFAQVMTPDGHAQLEALCQSVHDRANAELVVVTIKSLDNGQSIEEFTAALEEKWKLGKKGEDRSALLVLTFSPRRIRVETGYGLEGILNDAKVGRILDPAVPMAQSGDYDKALLTVVQGLADVIAADKGVTLLPAATPHQYHRQTVPSQGFGAGQVVLGVVGLILFVVLVRTGHIGWAFWLLFNLLGSGGGGGGGGGRDDDRGGGGFGGVGGGGSGGGGASRDF